MMWKCHKDNRQVRYYCLTVTQHETKVGNIRNVQLVINKP